MLDIKFNRENAELVKASAAAKRIDCDVDRLLDVDRRRRELQLDLDRLREKVKEDGQLVGLLRNPKSYTHSGRRRVDFLRGKKVDFRAFFAGRWHESSKSAIFQGIGVC